MKYEAVLFDLDGTLLDTAPDMIATINRMRTARKLPECDYSRLRPYVSHGAAALIREGLGVSTDSPEFKSLRQLFLDDYHKHICIETRLFDGMEDVLATLEKASVPWGIVTNKPGGLTHKLLQALKLDSRAACIVSGDTLEFSKPHPLPLQYACEVINVSPQNTLYIGDAERDIIAGNAAGMTTLVAGFGYISKNDHPEAWRSDAIIQHAGDILDWVSASIRPS